MRHEVVVAPLEVIEGQLSSLLLPVDGVQSEVLCDRRPPVPQVLVRGHLARERVLSHIRTHDMYSVLNQIQTKDQQLVGHLWATRT